MSLKRVLGGNRQEAVSAAARHNIKAWQHVIGIEDVRGLRRGDTIWLAGNYWAHPEYDEIAEYCVAHDIGMVKV